MNIDFNLRMFSYFHLQIFFRLFWQEVYHVPDIPHAHVGINMANSLTVVYKHVIFLNTSNQVIMLFAP